MVKQRYKNITSLAIGDGANDVNMITEAHVGLGIKGLEGGQAARSADFAIGEFKHMRRLLFYYGRESYRKSCNLVLFSFYKNIVLVLPQFFFSFFNFFSGQTLYDSFLYQFFNVLYAAAPIILYALFDHDSTDEVLENSPKYYEPGPKCKKSPSVPHHSAFLIDFLSFVCFQETLLKLRKWLGFSVSHGVFGFDF
jgi:phospholipid-transporting ATPase